MWRVTVASVAACCLLAVIQMSGMLEQPSDDVTVLSYHPPWEQAPTHYNRYRFKSTTQQLSQLKSIKHQQHTVKSKTVKIETGRAIFARLKAAAGRSHGMKKGRGNVSAKLTQVKKIKHQQHTVKSKPAKAETGKAIFARLKTAAGSLDGKTKGKGKVSAPKLAEDEEDTPEAKEGAEEPTKEGAEEPKEEEEEPKEEAEEPKEEAEEPKEEAEEPQEDAEDAEEPKAEESAEAPVDEEVAAEDPKTIYVYDGRETKPFSTDLVTFILAAGFAMPDIRYIKSSSDADIRSATWDDDCRAIIFPPLHDIPDFAPNAVKDLRHFVSKGQKQSGTMLFMGSSVEVHIINELFGFEMTQDFKEGPYYKNARATMGTVLEDLPSRVPELGNTENLGILKSSMPPETASYYDSFGDSVASCARWDLGRVCYLAQDFKPLEDLPMLQEQALSEDPRVAREAEYDLEVLSRKTDTWLAIFHGMLEQPKHATY